MANGDRWKTLAVLSVLLIEPALLVWQAGKPAGTGFNMSPLIAVPLAVLAMAGLIWWTLRRDRRDDE
jgi:lipopolysaccharide export LptBFGC system permease protein LptF